jgi:hypothetical protein
MMLKAMLNTRYEVTKKGAKSHSPMTGTVASLVKHRRASGRGLGERSTKQQCNTHSSAMLMLIVVVPVKHRNPSQRF